ncbi:hypothetical protein [Aquitalea aquatica]|uniref:Uncharacterized protein n=1 Tax=Aquitalea aquatica TaxID=3044273 RepID=A0A838YG33_9NEIS|nr:hypothetical protein [Aquitalea magnusonii]MBA4709561.1 hypothetical protein [Aquitalea magnusonii]
MSGKPLPKIDPVTAQKIADVLNKRGFVTHDDFPLVLQKEFGDFIKRKIRTLNKHGYTGGTLEPWSTNFRQANFTYGARVIARQVPDTRLDAYTNATAGPPSGLALSKLTIGDLSHLLLGLVFACPCGHQTKVDSNLYSFADRKKDCTQATAVCPACKAVITSPSDAYRLF